MLRIHVTNPFESLQIEYVSGPLEFGRLSKEGTVRRVLKDPYVSGDQLRLEGLSPTLLRLENLSRKVPIKVDDGSVIDVGATVQRGVPVSLSMGKTAIRIVEDRVAPPSASDALMTIAKPVFLATEQTKARIVHLSDAPDVEQLARWFETVVSVQRAAACSPEFYREIAQAVVDLIGMDCAVVLLRKNDEWQSVAIATKGEGPRVSFSHTILERVLRERRTFYQAGDVNDASQSLADVTTVVVSPIVDASGGDVTGAIYGARTIRNHALSSQIRPLDAQLVQVLAAAAGAGLARMESEAEAARRHVQFEQFFSRELAGELDRNPNLLIGQDREVTVLFSDVRGFSRIAERLGPRMTCLLMGDVLECLTIQIHKEGGVVVDYVGDGIMAMWNAPVLQADHASRACRAALAMLDELPELNSRWEERIGAKIALGIGLNTGDALVGNTGSRQRLKYGAFGNTVNVASRVEGATKQMGVPILITGSTRDRIDASFATRRLCRVRAVGIDTPIALHELAPGPPTPAWIAGRDAYERALDLYERGMLSDACRTLFAIMELREGTHDKPALTLAARAVEALRKGASEFDPVIALESK